MAPTKLAAALPLPTARTRRGREDLHIRNHDRTSAYDIRVRIEQSGDPRHRGEYHLRPEQSGCSLTLLSPGEYTVTATLPDGPTARAVVAVSDAPDETIFVAIRDGTVSVAEGVP